VVMQAVDEADGIDIVRPDAMLAPPQKEIGIVGIATPVLNPPTVSNTLGRMS
jgi:hypothetical protein